MNTDSINVFEDLADEDEIVEIMSLIDDISEDYSKITLLAAITAHITNIIVNSTPNEVVGRRILETVSSAILVNTSTALAYKYDPPESKPQ